MNRSVVATTLLSTFICLPLDAEQSENGQGPDRPDEAFSVYVSVALDDGTDAKQSEKVRKEVEKRIKDQKKWFIVAKTPDKAELFVEVVRHTVNEQMRHKLISRVDSTGANKQWVTETWAQEQHFMEVRMSAFGTQTLVHAEDARENGGSLKRVSENLAENLELHCRERYEELSQLRRQP